jgi:hypothetical protein
VDVIPATVVAFLQLFVSLSVRFLTRDADFTTVKPLKTVLWMSNIKFRVLARPFSGDARPWH